MVIGHDNKGEDPSWFLEEVEVDILETGDHYLFRCGRWLRIADGKNETETMLFPSPGEFFLKSRALFILFSQLRRDFALIGKKQLRK